MPDWPHAPVHRLAGMGAYMVTAGTYLKAPFFQAADRRARLQDLLLGLAAKHRWRLQAWAVLPNHYHFVGIVETDAQSLQPLVRELHSLTARQANAEDGIPGRRVWFQFWDTHLTFERSYLARLSYVHYNPVKHGLVSRATDYPYCSAAWFERNAEADFARKVRTFDGTGVNVVDDF